MQEAPSCESFRQGGQKSRLVRLPIEVLGETPLVGAVQQGRVVETAKTGGELAERIAADYPTFERRVRAIVRANPELAALAGDDLGDVLHSVWVDLRTGKAAVEVRDPDSFFALLVDHKTRDCARRSRVVPLDWASVQRVAASCKSPEEAAEEREARDQLLDVLASVPDEARAAFVFRVGFGLKPRAIANALQITPRRYRKQIEKAGKLLEQRAHERATGAACTELRPLIPKYVRAVLDGGENRRLRVHLRACASCRAALAEIRTDADRLAATIPLPAVLLGAEATRPQSGVLERMTEAASEVRQQLADAAYTGKQHAYSLASRATDPTPLGGARPGAAAAFVTACLAGGGAAAYCVEQGIPQPLRDAAQAVAPGGGDTKRPGAEAAQEPAPAHPDPVAVPVAPAPAPASAEPAPSEPAPAPAPPPPSQPVQEEREFGFERSAPAPSSAPAPAPAPEPVASAEGKEFGFER